jgi:hypothetical protein
LLAGRGIRVTTAITLVHLIHRHKGSETQTRDYEFSRASMQEHWQVGHADMAHSLHASSATTKAKPRSPATSAFSTTPARFTQESSP